LGIEASLLAGNLPLAVVAYHLRHTAAKVQANAGLSD
jgi:hypothetical protein